MSKEINFQTIDVDRNRVKERTAIATRILECPSIYAVGFERSPSRRGWHVTIFCTRKGCEKCRKKFDDSVRFNADHDHRKSHQQNVLFNIKTRYYPQKGIVKKNAKLAIEQRVS